MFWAQIFEVDLCLGGHLFTTRGESSAASSYDIHMILLLRLFQTFVIQLETVVNQ